MIFALILAGGSGTRFWPLSRHSEPKQFLNLCANHPMIEQTIQRIRPLVPSERIFIATNKGYHKKIESTLGRERVSKRNILFEPESRNTFAPIALIARRIYELDKEAVIIVLPCDHYIKDGRKFTKALLGAVKAAEEGYIVTLGIKPEKPETGYGYIKIKPASRGLPSSVYKVEKFIEKPALAKAKQLIKDKRYFWNSGIFIFSAKTMLEETKRLLPQDFIAVEKMLSARGVNRFWKRLTSTSVDYAIMEKTRRLALLPADFGWVDLGSWNSLGYFTKTDRRGNIFRGECLDIGSANILAWSPNKLLATIGLEDLIIVNTDDALLVCAKNRAQDVKAIVQTLKQRKLKKLL